MIGVAVDADRERGSGTVLALGLILAVLVLCVLVLGLVAALTAKQRATLAADLSALAAADAARGRISGQPCELAAKVARYNGAELLACASPDRDGIVLDVRVRAKIGGPLDFLGYAEAISRAGPPPLT